MCSEVNSQSEHAKLVQFCSTLPPSEKEGGMSKLLADTCKAINNANRAGKRQVMVRFTSSIVIRFLKLMLEDGYISQLTIIHDNRRKKIVVGLNGRLNKCGAICPNYCLGLNEIEPFRDKILPARQFGSLVLTTSIGVIGHNKCIENNTGGKVLGFFY